MNNIDIHWKWRRCLRCWKRRTIDESRRLKGRTKKKPWNQDQRSTMQQRQICPWIKEGWRPLSRLFHWTNRYSAAALFKTLCGPWGDITADSRNPRLLPLYPVYWSSLGTWQQNYGSKMFTKLKIFFHVAAWIHHWEKETQKLEI